MGDGRDLKDKATVTNDSDKTAEKFREELRDPFQVGQGNKAEGDKTKNPADSQGNKPADNQGKNAGDNQGNTPAGDQSRNSGGDQNQKPGGDAQADSRDQAEKPPEKVEAIKPWEQLSERERSNYKILQASAMRLLPYMQAEVLVGETEQKLQAEVTKLLNVEKDQERRKALQSLLDNQEGVDRKKVISDLLKDEQNEESKKTLQGLLEGERNRDSLSDLVQKVKDGDYEATMKFYRVAVQYLQKNITYTVVNLADMQIGDNPDPTAMNRFPEGSPLKLPMKDGFPAIYEYYVAQVKEGKVPLELSDDPTDLLSDTKRLAGLSNATNWFMTAEETVVRAQRQFDAEMLQKRLKEDFGVPASWDMPPEGDVRALDAWYAAALQMSNLMNRTRNYAQAYKSLSGITPDFRDQAIKELRELGAEIEFDPVSDKLTKCVIPMPKDLRLDLPENREKIRKLEAWLDKWHKPVDEAIEAYQKGYGSFLRYGDFTGPNDKGTVVYDKQGKISRILDLEGNPVTIFLRDGSQEEVIHKNNDGKFIDKVGREITPDTSNDGVQEKFDYTNHKFDTRTLPNGDVEITITRSFEKDNVVNYNYWFGKQVGTLEEKRIVKPNEYIGVVSNMTGRYELLRADDLKGWTGWRAKQMAMHHGGKVASVVMDVGLTVVGAPEAAVAIRAGRVGVAALQATRALIGITGFLTPALRTGAFDPALKHVGLDGNDIIKARHVAIMADVFVLGLGGSAMRVFTGAKQTAESASMLSKVAHVGMGATSFVYGPAIYEDIKYKLDLKAGRTEEQRTRRAETERGVSETDYRKFEHSFDFTNPEIRQATGQMLDSYMETMATGIKDAETKAKVEGIFARTKEILALPENHPDRKAFITELMAYHQPSGKEMLLERMNREPDKYSRELSKGDKSAEGNKKLIQDMDAELKGKKQSDKSEQEKVAATVAMLLLSTNKDGGLPQDGVLASRRETIPAHKKIETKVSHGGSYGEWKDVKAETVEQKFSVEDALKYLESRAATSSDHATRLAVADQLFRLGKLDSRQLAAVCADIVEKKDLPEALRMKAIFDNSGPRLGVLINELQHEEDTMRSKSQAEQMAFLGKINGLRAEDLKKSLINVASSDGQNGKANEPADLRAACGIAVYANQQDTVDARHSIIEAAMAKQRELSGKPGAFAGYVVDTLKKHLDAEIKDTDGKTADKVREEKLQSAVMLQNFGKINTGDKEFELGAQEYNRQLLSCITKPGQAGIATEVFATDKGAEVAHEVLRSLSIAGMSVQERQMVLSLLDTPLNNPATNRQLEKAKIIVLARLKDLVAGTDPALQQLRTDARTKLHAMLTPGDPNFTGQFGTLRLSAVKAITDVGYSDAGTVELLKRRLAYDPDAKDFKERSPAVRRAALEALYKINPDDAGEIAILHRTLERDPAVGRRARSMEQEMILRTGRDPRNLNDKAQETSAKLSEPYKASYEDGKQYVDGSRYKLLKEKGLDQALVAAHKSVYDETVEIDANKGTHGAGFSLAKGWDRISSFSMSEADRQVSKATGKVWAEYSPMSIELGRVAQDQNDKDAPRAINGLAYFLSNNCEEVWERDRTVMMNNFAIAMMDLCKPNKNRAQVATHIENLLTTHHEMQAQAQLYLLEGLRRLAADGAVDKARAARICAKALDQVTRAQNFRRPTDPDFKEHEQLQKELVAEVLKYRVRDPEILGYLKGAAENHPYASVKEAAGEAYGALSDGVNLTWQDVHAAPDGGTPASERAENLEQALKDPAMRDDRLVRLIFQTTEGLPISDTTDPRIPALIKLAQTTRDARIKEAVGFALLPHTTGDGNLTKLAFSLLAEVEKTGKPGQVKEAKDSLDAHAKRNDSWAKFIEEARKKADARMNGALETFVGTEQGYGMYTATYVPENVDARLKAYQDAAASGSASKEELIRTFTEATLEAHATGGQSKVAPTARRILLEGANDQVKLAAAFAMLKYLQSDAADISAAADALIALEAAGANAQIRSEATQLIKLFSDHKAEYKQAMDSARARKSGMAPTK
jgi:hypothetical protein